MCSELVRIPYDWGGVPIFGVGVLLALWAVIGLASFALAVRRFGWGAEAWSLLPVLLFTGAAIVGLPKLFPGGLPIRGYGLMVLAGGTAGVLLAAHRARRVGLHPEVIWSLAVWLFVGGVIGARLFYVVEYWDERFRTDSFWQTLGRVLNFPEGGLVIYGGLFGALTAVYLFLRRNKMPVLATFDLIAPSLLVGLALGRLGCLLNGCCYGGPTDLPWAVTFPRDSLPYRDQVETGLMYQIRLTNDPATGAPRIGHVEFLSNASKLGLKAGDTITRINGVPTPTLGVAIGLMRQAFESQQPLTLQIASGRTFELSSIAPVSRSRPVHPTQVYSAITAGFLAWFLWAYYPFRRRDGELIALLLTIYPVSRFLEEIIRTDEPAVFGTGLSISQNISLALAVGVIGLWIYLGRQPRGVTWPDPPSP